GVSSGLAREDALTLGAQTLLGSAMLAVESGRDLDELVEAVASPGGTTIEGLKALREGNFEEAVKKAVISATKKSKELSS
ncbi:MAG: pyrroline-5-carboxylate reductase, partial [Deltaproteobacteria bacterium]|nr:pyrroline-5-carboxylate reductase [Deltaproteobacteria bacterium]